MEVINIAIINWDTVPSAGDCFDDASWNSMVLYIKHSHSCDFIIYDDESSTSQKFKFSYAGNDNILEGDDTTGKNLILKATSADTYPYILLEGNGETRLYAKNNIWFYENGTQYLMFDWNDPYATIYGAANAGKALEFVANRFDQYPILTMLGNNTITAHAKTYMAFYQETRPMAIFAHDGVNTSVFEGAFNTGKILKIKATDADAYPFISLNGNAGIDLYTAVGSDFKVINGNGYVTLTVTNIAANHTTYLNGSSEPGSLLEIRANNGDYNGDIWLRTGTGVVKFGAYSGLGAETLSGFITIKDAGGNLRKLAVVA